LLDWGEVDFSDFGLCPLGVTRAKDGTKGAVGSGVRGCGGGEKFSRPCRREAELIHFSVWDPGRGGDSGAILKLSAKWSLMNLFIKLSSAIVQQPTS
jgi:hypothetical protein